MGRTNRPGKGLSAEPGQEEGGGRRDWGGAGGAPGSEHRRPPSSISSGSSSSPAAALTVFIKARARRNISPLCSIQVPWN